MVIFKPPFPVKISALRNLKGKSVKSDCTPSVSKGNGVSQIECNDKSSFSREIIPVDIHEYWSGLY